MTVFAKGMVVRFRASDATVYRHGRVLAVDGPCVTVEWPRAILSPRQVWRDHLLEPDKEAA